MRPAVEAGEHLGFLPGDLEAKINPYLRPLLDALHDLMEYDQIRRYMDNDLIEIAPLGLHARAHAQRRRDHPRRGSECDRAADEDVPDPDGPERADRRHGRHHAGRPPARNARAGWPTRSSGSRRSRGLATALLDRSDIVRHPLVQAIVDAYEASEPAVERDGRIEPEPGPAEPSVPVPASTTAPE